MNVLQSAGRRAVSALRPHPLNDEIYGDRADSDLVESIRTKGVLNPLVVTWDNRIISGHRRWSAASALGMDEVPVVVFGSQDELDIEEALIETNRQRTKSNEQVGREYRHLRRILNERESRQGQRETDTSGRFRPEVEKPSIRAATTLGVGHNRAKQAERVVEVIDALEEAGDEKAAATLRTRLNHSVNGAYTAVKETGYLQAAAKPEPVRKTHSILSVSQWEAADFAQRSEWLFEQHGGTSTFNATNDNIEWARWSWNPVTGCLHGCEYCYARDIANRFYTQKFEPSFLPERLTAPRNTPVPDLTQYAAHDVERIGKRNVFVCSMADLFGKWVPTAWIEEVLQQAWDNPQWTFLFLTKFPVRMADFQFPANSWIGTSVDKQWAVERAEKAFTKVRESGYRGVAWLSCEPMLEQLTFNRLDMFDWVVMGGASKSTQTPDVLPYFGWIASLYQQARADNVPVYMKTNLGITQRVREYPKESA